MNYLNNPPQDKWNELLARPTEDSQHLENLISEIFETVREKGDQAVLDYTSKFDGCRLSDLRVGEQEIEGASEQVSTSLKKAIALAKKNIHQFHASQEVPVQKITTSPGVVCWQEKRPVQKIGLYIPGGTAPLFSTILMLAVPAQIAGCQEIVVCTPPDSAGKVHPVILYTCALCGIRTVFKVGGAQAIAGLTFGTESLPSVYKIFGPGNQFVTAAKQMATRFGVAIDMPAGPSELLVVADDSAEAGFVAADLLSQAEHGPDSQVVLLALCEEFLIQVQQQVREQLRKLPRQEVARKALDHSLFIFLKDQKQALNLINQYAPEHLIVCTRDNPYFLKGLRNAGSVFIGNYSPESAGDYASGTNHTLPTQGYARQYSGLSLESFQKSISFQEISPRGIREIGPAIEIMASAEGLQGHSRAVSLRLESLIEKKHGPSF